MVSTGPWTNLGQRLGTALILAAVSLGLIWLGSGFFMVEVIVLALAGSCEIFDLVERKRLRPLRRTGTLATLFLLGACFHSGILGLAYALGPCWWCAFYAVNDAFPWFLTGPPLCCA